jgi:hypothetical protein
MDSDMKKSDKDMLYKLLSKAMADYKAEAERIRCKREYSLNCATLVIQHLFCLQNVLQVSILRNSISAKKFSAKFSSQLNR